METIVLNSTKINYFDNLKKDSPVIVFIHGNSQSLLTFSVQLKNKQLSKFRLIAIDLPGHGHSTPLAHKHYGVIELSNLLTEFSSTLNLENVIYVGHSLGGHILLHSSPRLNAAGFFISGAPPVSKSTTLAINPFNSSKALELLFQKSISFEQATKLVHLLNYENRPVFIERSISDILNTDPSVRTSIAECLSQGHYYDECKIIENLKKPISLIFGQHDEIVNFTYIQSLNDLNVKDLSINIINDSSHNTHSDNSHEYNKLLLDFVERCLSQSTEPSHDVN